MQNTQSIGTLAENIIAVSFRNDGTVTPVIRHRDPDGRMADRMAFRPAHARQTPEIAFVARVPHGSAALATMAPNIWGRDYSFAVVPLGNQRREADPASPGPSSAGSAGADEIHFRLADGRLTWRSENLSGEMVLNETYPELTVSLRLPPGNHGAIEFAAPLLTTPGGEQTSVLAVA